jgi:hypothetical protein
MDEKIQGASRLMDYGVLGIVCAMLITVVWLAAKMLIKSYEERLKEKDAIILRAHNEIIGLRNTVDQMREKVEHRLGDLLDSCGDSISQNSIALHENSSVVKTTQGILLLIAELMKNNLLK